MREQEIIENMNVYYVIESIFTGLKPYWDDEKGNGNDSNLGVI